MIDRAMSQMSHHAEVGVQSQHFQAFSIFLQYKQYEVISQIFKKKRIFDNIVSCDVRDNWFNFISSVEKVKKMKTLFLY